MAGEDAGAAEQRTQAVGARFSREWLMSTGQRSVTALFLIPVIVGIVWFGGWVAFGCTLLVSFAGLLELRVMLAHRGLRPIMLLSTALGVDFLVAAMLPAQRSLLIGLGISAMIVLSFSWLMLARKATLKGAVTAWALSVALPFYLCWPLAYFLLMRGGMAGYQSAGFWWTLTTLFGVWAFDTFAYFAGARFGRHHLAPSISPKKTWEGAAGGLIFTLVAVALFTHPLGVAWYHVIALAVLISAAATIGDLAESLLKRDVGVKDSGSIMPGHGGLLDRVDSLLFAVMVVYYYATFIGSIPHA
jgi:phosphatidate cytidylyltransferase